MDKIVLLIVIVGLLLALVVARKAAGKSKLRSSRQAVLPVSVASDAQTGTQLTEERFITLKIDAQLEQEIRHYSRLSKTDIDSFAIKALQNYIRTFKH